MNFGAATVPLGLAEAEVRRVLAPSIANDPLEDLDEVIAAIERKDEVCWLISEGTALLGVVVTVILKTTKGAMCVIHHCAGEGIDGWLKFLPTIEAWAKGHGCSAVELIGRPGWERMLGWHRQAVVLRKPL